VGEDEEEGVHGEGALLQKGHGFVVISVEEGREGGREGGRDGGRESSARYARTRKAIWLLL